MEHTPFTILVVDDEPDLVPLIKQRMRPQIRSREFAFLFASDGVEALEILSADDHIELVITDINMPRMDGLTLLKNLADIRPDVKALVISAYGDMRNIRTAMNMGAFDFLMKPVDFEDFKLTIRRTQAYIKQWKEARDTRDELVVMRSELDRASEVQRSILPVTFPSHRKFDIAGDVKSAQVVSGDFIDLILLDTVSTKSGQVGLLVADVSGKGVPAALFMMHSRTLLKSAAIGQNAPGKVLSEVNAHLVEGNQSFMFVSVLYVVYDYDSGVLTYANGGHCNPVIVHSDGSCTELQDTDGIVLGLAENFTFAERQAAMEPGESLILFSDGVLEARSPEEEEFGMERLKSLFAEAPPDSAAQVCERIRGAVDEFTGNTPQYDDITYLVLHRNRE